MVCLWTFVEGMTSCGLSLAVCRRNDNYVVCLCPCVEGMTIYALPLAVGAGNLWFETHFGDFMFLLFLLLLLLLLLFCLSPSSSSVLICRFILVAAERAVKLSAHSGARQDCITQTTEVGGWSRRLLDRTRYCQQ